MEHVSRVAGGAPGRQSPRNAELGSPPTAAASPVGAPASCLRRWGGRAYPGRPAGCPLRPPSSDTWPGGPGPAGPARRRPAPDTAELSTRKETGPPRERHTASWEKSSHSKRGEVTELAYQTSRLPRKCGVPGLPAASWAPSSRGSRRHPSSQ